MTGPAAGGRVRTRVRVEGIVQGVGFRPYVFGLATRLALAGFVGNDAQGVFLEIEGPEAAVAEFLRVLETEPPPQVAATGVGKDDQQFEARFWLPSGTTDLPAVVASVTLALQQAVQRLHRLREV